MGEPVPESAAPEFVAEDISITTTACGTVWDVSVAAFRSPDEDGAVIGLEITDLAGRLQSPRIGVFVLMEGDGRKAFLTADRAREFAAEILAFADLLDAGATSAAVQ